MAKSRLRIFRKDGDKEQDQPGYNDFLQYYKALGLQGPAS